MFNYKKYKQRICKEATRSGTPTMLDPDSRSRRRNPYLTNDPLKGEGWNYVTMGENDAVGGGNTRRPSTIDGDVGADPRTYDDFPSNLNEQNTGEQKSIPSGQTLLENEEAGILDVSKGGRSHPPEEGWKNFMDQGSPLNPINHNDRDTNEFQSQMGNSNLMFGGKFSDIIKRIRHKV